MPHLKAVGPDLFGLIDIDAINLSRRRAPMQQINELLDRPFFAFEMGLDATVGRIAHPA